MNIANRVSAYNRDRKWRRFLELVKPTPETRVLDVGYNEHEYAPAADRVAVDNYIERHYPWPENITALGVEEAVEFRRRYPKVNAVRYGGDVFPFEDRSFDVVWSNAVIEHVGDFDRQVLFVREMARVGKQVYFSTPNRGFPIELHTRLPLVHWLPKTVCDRILRQVGKGFASGDYMYLLTKGALMRVLRAAGVERYRLYRNRLAGWTMDFVVFMKDRAGSETRDTA